MADKPDKQREVIKQFRKYGFIAGATTRTGAILVELKGVEPVRVLVQPDGSVIHVSGDGKHIVGLGIKMPVRCQGGHLSILEISLLSYAKNLPIANHIARAPLETAADNEFRAGHIGVYALFNAPGSLEGRLHIHIPSTSRRVGLCSGTLKFTAKR